MAKKPSSGNFDMATEFQRAIPLDGYRLWRDQSLSEKDDYQRNILPYRQQGFTIEPLGEHRYGYFVIMGWRILPHGTNRY